MSFSKDVVELALVAAGRCRCICHKFCGVRIETHHIRPVSKGGDNSFENCIPLCFDCHAEVEHYNDQYPRVTPTTAIPGVRGMLCPGQATEQARLDVSRLPMPYAELSEHSRAWSWQFAVLGEDVFVCADNDARRTSAEWWKTWRQGTERRDTSEDI